MLYAPLARPPVLQVARRRLPTFWIGTPVQPAMGAPLAVKATVPPFTGGLAATVAISETTAPAGPVFAALLTVVLVGAVRNHAVDDLRQRRAGRRGVAGVAAIAGDDAARADRERGRGTGGGAAVARAGDDHRRATGDADAVGGERDVARRGAAADRGGEGDAAPRWTDSRTRQRRRAGAAAAAVRR